MIISYRNAIRHLKWIFCLLLIGSCRSSATTVDIRSESIESYCPDDGVCKLETFQNSILNIRTDGTNATYITIASGDKLVVKFSYNRTYEQEYADGFYIEEIYAEIDSTLDEIVLQDGELKAVNLYFNRMCYCKGTAGFFPITKGNLSLKKIDSGSFRIDLEFEMNQVPHIVTGIHEIVILK